jgi:hypothetical protein
MRWVSFSTRCGLNALPPYETVEWSEWRTLPVQAKCGNCDRLHWQHRSATPAEVLAVETALHGIASVFAQPPTDDKGER